MNSIFLSLNDDSANYTADEIESAYRDILGLVSRDFGDQSLHFELIEQLVIAAKENSKGN